MSAPWEGGPDPEAFLAPYWSGADHVDVKRIAADLPLDRFLLGMLSHFPWWLRVLYGARAGLAALLGLEGTAPGETIADLLPGEVSFTPGEVVLFFTVRDAQEGSCEAVDRQESGRKARRRPMGKAQQPLWVVSTLPRAATQLFGLRRS